MINPYWSANFIQFIALFFHRFFALITGSLTFDSVASDEVQIFTLCAISISSAFVGSFLTLRKLTMLANALSHTILFGIVATFLVLSAFGGGVGMGLSIPFNALFIAALFTGFLTTFCTEFLHRKLRVQEDASIGMVFTLFFALGIVLISLFARNAHIGIEIVTGNVDALHKSDMRVAFSVMGLNIALFLLFFKEFKTMALDTRFAKSVGVATPVFHYLLMFLTSATAISAFRAVGVLLVLAFLVIPVHIAKLYAKTLKRLITYAALIGCGCSFVGVALSRHVLSVFQWPLSTSGLVVVVLSVVYMMALIPYFLKSRRNVSLGC